MSWARLAIAVACSFCEAPIAAGQPVRRSTVETMAHIRWCETCARKRLDESAPADLPDAFAAGMPVSKPRAASTFASFDRKGTGSQLRANILNWRRDGRMEATGEQGR